MLLCYLDTAAVYNNEQYIKDALKVLLPKYHLKREDLFITSKLGIHFFNTSLTFGGRYNS